MKKVIIIFVGAAMALISCKSHTDGLASAGADDVYYNPSKDWKPNVVPQPEQFTAKAADPNAGKIGVTEADRNNPYYQDPNFNYDDYYDNAYASRIRRFNNPIYGTGYYDTWNTNSYFYNGNPSCYGNSIYNSYNMGYGANNGYGYYSPSNSFWNSYYNPYYNGFGNSYGGNGWGMGMSYGYGYGNMGYGGFNNYGYSPFGAGYGYNPYGGYGGYNGYGNGYNPYGYGSYNPYGGYFNSYDYNSSSYSNYGPRGSHTGGNSGTTSPIPGPRQIAVSKPVIDGSPGSSPYNQERFNQVNLPKEHYGKILETRNPVKSTYYQPVTTEPGGGRPSYNNGSANTGGTYTDPTYHNNTNYGGGAIKNNTIVQPANTESESRPRKWVISGNDSNTGGNNNSGGSNSSGSWGNAPTGTGTGVKGGGGSSGGNNNSGGSNSGGGISRPRK